MHRQVFFWIREAETSGGSMSGCASGEDKGVVVREERCDTSRNGP